MKKILSFTLILIIQSSCLNMVDPKHQTEYIEIYNSFDKELINHFPNKLPNNYIASALMSPQNIRDDYNLIDVYLRIQLSSIKEYQSKKKHLIKEVKLLKNSKENCLLIIKPKLPKIEINQEISLCDKLIPVPYDTIYEFNSEKEKFEKLSNNEIGIIDYQSGVFLKGLNEKENLPKKWKNGYSKGYTFNDTNQTITYWLIIW